MKAGLLSVTFRQLEPSHIIDAAARAGLEGIEWGGDVHVPHGNIDVARSVAEDTKAGGLKVSAYGSYFKFAQALADPKQDEAEFTSVLETAKALGAPLIRIWAGNKGSADMPADERLAIIRQCLIYAQLASAAGIELAFEYHGNTLTDTHASAHELLRAIPHPAVNTFWQPYANETPEASLDGIRLNLSRIRNVHCFYWGPGGWNDKRPLAEGAANWKSFLSELSKASTDRWISLEFVKDESVQQMTEDAATLLEMIRS